MPSLSLGLTAFLAAALLLGTHAHAADKPRVVTSLKPVELLVRAVAHDQVEVTTLVPAGSSPHTYQLRPSERRQLAAADMVFWVGPGMENFLTRLLTGPDFRNRTIALAGPSGDTRSQDRHEHGQHDDHAAEHDHAQHDDHEEAHDEEHPPEENGAHDHDHGDGEDPHIWLDPILARDMARDIAAQLKTLEGVDKAAINRHLAAFEEAIDALEKDIRRQLAPARSLELFTYHDAFRRFADHYDLTIAGVLTLSPERTPGARHLADVQERLNRASQACLITEPQFDRQWWDSLMSDVSLPVSTWDPLAGSIDATPRGYLLFQQSLADAVLDCLPEHAQQ